MAANNYWIFSNKPPGSYGTQDWDTEIVLKTKHYYLREKERNRGNINTGDVVVLRTYGYGYWGTCEIDKWEPDPDGMNKYDVKTGWFVIKDVEKWKTHLPLELIANELSNRDIRSRVIKITEKDFEKIIFALKIYQKLGYGDTDGEFFLLENGIEEAVKLNLSRLGLKLAGKNIQQQFNMGLGAGRSDLICVDNDNNYVVIELKAQSSSDVVVGQILRYMGFVRENIVQKEQKVKGIILTPSFDESLRLSAKEAKIKILRLRII